MDAQEDGVVLLYQRSEELENKYFETINESTQSEENRKELLNILSEIEKGLQTLQEFFENTTIDIEESVSIQLSSKDDINATKIKTEETIIHPKNEENKIFSNITTVVAKKEDPTNSIPLEYLQVIESTINACAIDSQDDINKTDDTKKKQPLTKDTRNKPIFPNPLCMNLLCTNASQQKSQLDNDIKNMKEEHISKYNYSQDLQKRCSNIRANLLQAATQVDIVFPEISNIDNLPH